MCDSQVAIEYGKLAYSIMPFTRLSRTFTFGAIAPIVLSKVRRDASRFTLNKTLSSTHRKRKKKKSCSRPVLPKLFLHACAHALDYWPEQTCGVTRRSRARRTSARASNAGIYCPSLLFLCWSLVVVVRQSRD